MRDGRRVPQALLDAWELALEHNDPLIALSAARAVRAHLAGWEAELVREAIDNAATWEMIGDATGTSRQAAWERFHEDTTKKSGAANSGRARYEREFARLRSEVDRLKRRGGRGT